METRKGENGHLVLICSEGKQQFGEPSYSECRLWKFMALYTFPKSITYHLLPHFSSMERGVRE